jgi:ATP-dependent Clp protease ATP-binding subunit ClpA
MSPWSGPALERASSHLAPYARAALEQASFLAARLHSDEVSPEHFLAAMLEDESCGATRLILHAFADPETIAIEVRALCAGIMVVGSERSLPFSVLGVQALREARARAHATEERTVTPAHVFRAAAALLPSDLRERLAELGRELTADARDPHRGDSASEAFFRSFSPGALRALGGACRAAATLGRASIGPVHLLLGCLDADEELRAATGLSASRVRMALAGRDEDGTPLPSRHLAGDARIGELLRGLPAAAETVDVLGWILSNGTEELVALLLRQRITPALFERCRGAFPDPDRPSSTS